MNNNFVVIKLRISGTQCSDYKNVHLNSLKTCSFLQYVCVKVTISRYRLKMKRESLYREDKLWTV